MATDVQQFIQTKKSSPEEIAARTREIYDTVLRESAYIDGGNISSPPSSRNRSRFVGFPNRF